MSSTVPHFEESGRFNPVSAQDKMPAQEFGIALDYLVLTCVDLVLVNRDRILLAQRHQYPRPSWWVIGGRMSAGESPLQAAQRKAWEEAHLSLPPERFHYLGAFSTCFARRAQEPQHHGLHSVNLTYQVSLADTETTQIRLVDTEYTAIYQWADCNTMQKILDPDDSIDQVLWAIAATVFHQSKS
jgi:ADP-ribose pyrophosphatase YjhB (NUDIX family)